MNLKNELKILFFSIFPGEKLQKTTLSNHGFNYTAIFRAGLKLNDLNEEFEREYWILNPLQCKHCNKPILLNDTKLSAYRVKIFCSRSCSATFNNTGFVKNTHGLTKFETLNVNGTIKYLSAPETKCEWCKINNTKERFCSKDCSDKESYCSHFLDWYLCLKPKTKNSSMRKYLADIYGYQCDNHRLGKTCYTDPKFFPKLVLEVDHIDGHHENNAPSNVRLLCPSCHMKTDTFTGKNKGNGREYRRIRYEEGKSF